MAKRFFETGEKVFLIAGFDMNQPVRMKPGLRDCWDEEIPACDYPDHLPCGTRGYPGSEQRSCSSVDAVVAASGNFMQAAECKSSSWKLVVDRRHSERKDAARALCSSFDAGNALP